MELYREMITPYTGSSPLAVPAGAPLEGGQALCLAVPVVGDPRTGFWLDDPLYPLECEVPAKHVRSFRKLLAAFAAEPVMTVARISQRHGALSSDALAALPWMIESGLVLRSLEEPDGLDPRSVQPSVAQPLFSFQRLPPDGPDFVVAS